MLDRLDPRALTRALLGPRPRAAGALAGRRPACAITVPAARPGKHKRWPGTVRAVAVDGKTLREPAAPNSVRTENPLLTRLPAARLRPGDSRSTGLGKAARRDVR